MSLEPLVVPEEQVVALGDLNLIRKHQRDAHAVNTLILLIREAEALIASWDQLGDKSRRRFLDDRQGVLAHAFSIACLREDDVSTLVLARWREAVAAWQALVPRLLTLQLKRL